ncbi:type II toxin-antitoxin system VapC family toxin [Streptomyces sp. ISL-96]|uniref:type II toxin-antitoxin system VapC family toxin n=1 Tax=Streptomyces sp. ISL-96 TaxID=2819191 RepID=UPI001BEBC63F|nr:type II toxin-antitoxin system VapC family toxin [Streptomyces sp. ISL-96]MBT2491807.1 type II toxin-antitoxin system VapC family toxin [Streptomyces sp. ISL-96]
MKLLLDTHVVLWWLNASPELSPALKDLLRTEPDVYISAATPWEIAIKHSLGKLDSTENLAERARDLQFMPLPITAAHGVRAARLPSHHRDPFDRVLIAQAQMEELTLVTRDKSIPQYDVQIMAA